MAISEWARGIAMKIAGKCWYPNTDGVLGLRDEIAEALDEARKMGEPTPPAPPVPCPTCGTMCITKTNCTSDFAVYTPIANPRGWSDEIVRDSLALARREGERDGERAALKRVYAQCVNASLGEVTVAKSAFPYPYWVFIQIPRTLWREIEKAGKS